MSTYSSKNPTLAAKYFNKTYTDYAANQGLMSVRGTLNKFGFLLLMLIAASTVTWHLFGEGKGSTVMALTIGGAIIGLIIAIVMSFKPTLAQYLAPAYAIAEGFFIGGFSVLMNEMFKTNYPNLILHSIGLTFGVALAMFLLYNFRIIKVTARLRSIIMTATLGIFIYYMLIWIIGLFGVRMDFAFDSSLLSIGISLFIVGIAAFNLLLDFDMIEQGAVNGAPKFMEWFGAFGLLVTLVWLYLEIVRLLSKINSKN